MARSSTDAAGGPPLDEPPADLEEVRGWEGLAEWTGGLPPEEVEALAGVRELEPVYPLLHALVGRSLRDFFARAAVVEALVESGRPAFRAEDLDEVLSWLGEEPRARLLASLRQSGWLEYDPATGHVLTEAGLWSYEILSFLHKRLRAGELLPTLAGVQYALDIGLDPLRNLQTMRARLAVLQQQIEEARASHSEVVLRRTARKVDEAVRLSSQIRAVLDRVRPDRRATRRVVRDIHDQLSRLHGASAELQAAITEVGRQYLHLTAGLTVEQIVHALMAKSRAELAALGREALLPALPSP
ncbi:MAG: hypothetical protein ACRD2T_12100, partial [Thermoanaerobaculia bacterium]